MHRRKFIRNTLYISSGLFISHSLIGCNSNVIQLNEIIGKSDEILTPFSKEGDDFFAYYILTKQSFIHPKIKGNQVFIYCQEGIIVGYTIKINGIEKIEDLSKRFSQQYGPQSLVFENDFGKEYEWKTNNKKIMLCFSKENLKLPQNTYYSEALLSNNLLVF